MVSHRPVVFERLEWTLAGWDDARAKLVDVGARMTGVLDEHDLTALVTSIDGLSPVGATAILSETGDLTRFTSARAVVQHAGLAPGERKSGTFTDRARATGAGRPQLRVAAWRGIRELILRARMPSCSSRHLVSDGVQKRDVFADVTSGSKTAIQRPGMKGSSSTQRRDTVVVWQVDRLGRSLIDVLNTVNLLREHGVQGRSISDGIDPATSTGQLMLNMLATLTEYERELIVERVNAGIAAARQNGTRFPLVLADKLAIAQDARAKECTRRRGPPRGLEPCNSLPPPANPRRARGHHDVGVPDRRRALESLSP